MIQNPNDHFPAVHKPHEDNSYPSATSMPVVPAPSPAVAATSPVSVTVLPVLPASSPVIPAQAGIHCDSRSAPATKSDLRDHA